MNYENLCNQVCKIAQEAGAFIAQERQYLSLSKIHQKGVHDFVTEVDKASEKMLVEQLEALLPNSGFLVEENTKSILSDEFNWIIDPLDGTTNYIHGLPIYAVSIALQYKNETVLGVVYEIGQQECFYAWKGSKAFLNGKEIWVSATPNLESSLLATGFPFVNYSKLPQYMELLAYTMRHTRGLRRLGSAATDLAYVACGRVDGFYEYGLKPWDMAAGALIVQQAGGKNSDFAGENNFLFKQEIISANPAIFKEFLFACAKFLK